MVSSLALSTYSYIHLCPNTCALPLSMTLFNSSRFLCCSMPSFGVSTTSPKQSSLFHVSPASANIFIKCWNRHHMKNSFRYKGNIDNTSVIIFLIKSWLSKTPSNGTCLGEPPGGFCDVGCCCCFWSHWIFLFSLLFDIISHPSVTYRQVFTPIFTGSATVFSELFLPTGVFYPTFLHFVTQMWAGPSHPRSSSVPAFTELSLPADTWTWTIDVWVTRPLIYRSHQWATKHRVKIGLLNMFCFFKVIYRDY